MCVYAVSSIPPITLKLDEVSHNRMLKTENNHQFVNDDLKQKISRYNNENCKRLAEHLQHRNHWKNHAHHNSTSQIKAHL